MLIWPSWMWRKLYFLSRQMEGGKGDVKGTRGQRERGKGFQSHKKIKFWQYFQISIFFLSPYEAINFIDSSVP